MKTNDSYMTNIDEFRKNNPKQKKQVTKNANTTIPHT